VKVFDILGVADFLRARYGDALYEDTYETHVHNQPGDFTVIELKLIITKESMTKGVSHDQECGCPTCPLHARGAGS
jgi:hypothetical protein